MVYRIRIDRIEDVADTTRTYVGKAEGGGDRYLDPLPGATREKTAEIYDQVLDRLDVAELVRFINREQTYRSTGPVHLRIGDCLPDGRIWDGCEWMRPGVIAGDKVWGGAKFAPQSENTAKPV